MRRARNELIDELVDDLTPSRGPRRVETLVAIWLVVSWLLVVAVTVGIAPLREGWWSQLLGNPRFLAETLLGWAAGAAAITCAFQLGRPGPGRPLRRSAAALVLAALWVGAYVLDLAAPALDPSTDGMRNGCTLQVLVFGLPPLLLGLAMLRRLAPIDRAFTGAVVGAAGGAVPALLMQLACMYVPGHILIHHMAPVLLLAALGAGLGVLMLRRV
ncbi:MAG: NrsF family protein [Myxococcota bacterium]